MRQNMATKSFNLRRPTSELLAWWSNKSLRQIACYPQNAQLSNFKETKKTSTLE
jgi:hypothetical protein